MARDCILAWKVFCVSRLCGGPRLYAGWEVSLCGQLYSVPRLYAGRDGSLCIQAIWGPETVCFLGKVLCVTRLHGVPILYSGSESTFEARLLLCLLGRFFVYPGYMVARDCMLAGQVLCVARLYGGPRLMLAGKVLCVTTLYGGPRLYAGWEGSLCIQAICWPETV